VCVVVMWWSSRGIQGQVSSGVQGQVSSGGAECVWWSCGGAVQ